MPSRRPTWPRQRRPLPLRHWTTSSQQLLECHRECRPASTCPRALSTTTTCCCRQFQCQVHHHHHRRLHKTCETMLTCDDARLLPTLLRRSRSSLLSSVRRASCYRRERCKSDGADDDVADTDANVETSESAACCSPDGSNWTRSTACCRSSSFLFVRTVRSCLIWTEEGEKKVRRTNDWGMEERCRWRWENERRNQMASTVGVQWSRSA